MSNKKEYDRIHMLRSGVQGELSLCARTYKQRPGNKPSGFWYGIDNSWIDWCSNEMPEWVTPHRYKLEIDMSKVLVVDTIEKMYDLNKFVVNTDEYFNRYNYDIDWAVFDKMGYKGIEIPRYMYELRRDDKFFWYYSWDIASGCIWDTNIIKSVTKI